VEGSIANHDRNQIGGKYKWWQGQNNSGRSVQHSFIKKQLFFFFSLSFDLKSGHFQANCRKTYTEEHDKCVINEGVLRLMCLHIWSLYLYMSTTGCHTHTHTYIYIYSIQRDATMRSIYSLFHCKKNVTYQDKCL
jgi:hypothetical protein